MDTEGMKVAMTEARGAGHTRLFALAYDRDLPVQWHSRQDEAEMKAFLDSRDESESLLFNCAVAVVVVNPQDSEEVIDFIIASKYPRPVGGLGYFAEAL